MSEQSIIPKTTKREAKRGWHSFKESLSQLLGLFGCFSRHVSQVSLIVVRRTERLIESNFGLVARGLTSGVFDGALGLVRGIFRLFAIHSALPCCDASATQLG